MSLYVADTHALHWYLTGDARLGPQARLAFDNAAAGNSIIYVSAISVAELFYLNQKAGDLKLFHDELRELRSSSQFVLVPLLAQDVPDFETDAAIPEMHDRIIVGLARRLGATLLSRDTQIASSGIIPTTW